MYRPSAIVLLLVLPLLAVGQQWTMLRPGWKYNYASTNSGVVDARIFITATDTPDVGVVTHDLNRVAEWCDTCSSQFRTDLPQFLQRSVTVSNGVWHFHDPASVVMLPLAALDSAWVMDTLANVIAQVTSVDALEQFGVPDVQKTISCSNGDTWVVSQEWGIMRVNELELRGSRGRMSEHWSRILGRCTRINPVTSWKLPRVHMVLRTTVRFPQGPITCRRNTPSWSAPWRTGT